MITTNCVCVCMSLSGGKLNFIVFLSFSHRLCVLNDDPLFLSPMRHTRKFYRTFTCDSFKPSNAVKEKFTMGWVKNCKLFTKTHARVEVCMSWVSG